MKNKSSFVVIAAAAALCVLATCAPPVGGPGGNLVVTLPAGPALSLVPSAGLESGIAYTITASGPGGPVTQTLAAGQTTAVFNLALGNWTITATALVDGVAIGSGSANIALTGQEGQSVSISLAFYDETDFTGTEIDKVFTVRTPGDWTAALSGISTGGNNKNYIINVSGVVDIPGAVSTPPSFGSVTGVTVSIRGGGTLAINSQGIVFCVESNQTVILRDVTLTGRPTNSAALAWVTGGALKMYGGTKISGNTDTTGVGGGVYMNGGTFTMNGGTITNNAAIRGAGVYVVSGTFTMNGGTITNNTASANGGGVAVGSGTFTMNGGTIGGNEATDPTAYGGGVYFDGTAFTKNGGIIYGSDAGVLDKNTAGADGHAVYVYVDGGSGDKKRNITAGSTVGLDSTTPFNWE